MRNNNSDRQKASICSKLYLPSGVVLFKRVKWIFKICNVLEFQKNTYHEVPRPQNASKVP